MRITHILIAVLLAGVLLASACGGDDDAADTTATSPVGTAGTAAAAPTKTSGTVILATTTSTQDSGLLDVLVPMFQDETGYTVKTVAVGSGQAIEQGSRGDADVLLVHSPAAEQAMVEAGDGIERALVMHNDFIIVGPAEDPAGVKSATTASEAMTAISSSESPFVSRGDDSGTHALELRLWKAINVTPEGQSWYSESGQGMGATLQIANQTSAYTISDRATYLAQKENLDLEILYEGDPSLLNVYHVIVVNPDKHANVNGEAARAFAAWIVRADIQEAIGEFGMDEFGEALFFPDAGEPEPAP